jgi:hypothetical protein
MPGSFVESYKSKHRHPLNKLSHSIGIPMIVVSLSLFFFSWRWALASGPDGHFSSWATPSKVISPRSLGIRSICSSDRGGWCVVPQRP